MKKNKKYTKVVLACLKLGMEIYGFNTKRLQVIMSSDGSKNFFTHHRYAVCRHGAMLLLLYALKQEYIV